jgi:hypothetical protein
MKHHSLWTAIVMVVVSVLPAAGTEYFVDDCAAPTCQDLAPPTNGTSAKPFRTIRYAARFVNPGDIVTVKNGTYVENDQGAGGITLIRPGTDTAWITFRAQHRHRALLRSNAKIVLNVTSTANYNQIDGFDVQNTRNRDNSGDGQGQGLNATNTHHVIFSHNKVHECAHSGIIAFQSDFVRIEDNEVFHNAFWNPGGGSGINLHWLVTSTATPGARFANGFGVQVRRNLVYRNESKVDTNNVLLTSASSSFATDGNGIIADRNRDGTATPYSREILIENNVILDNGGRAIQIYRSNNVLARNNTTYLNLKTLKLGSILGASRRGEINITGCVNCRIVNNLLFGRPGLPVASEKTYVGDGLPNTGTTWTYNLLWHTSSDPIIGVGVQAAPTNLLRDPLFVIRPSTPPIITATNYQLASGSPARNSGTLLHGRDTFDYTGSTNRILGPAIDIGAYERE